MKEIESILANKSSGDNNNNELNSRSSIGSDKQLNEYRVATSAKIGSERYFVENRCFDFF
jgi:hypothetical protein